MLSRSLNAWVLLMQALFSIVSVSGSPATYASEAQVTGKRRLPREPVNVSEGQDDIIQAVLAQYTGVLSGGILNNVEDALSSFDSLAGVLPKALSTPLSKVMASTMVSTTDQERQILANMEQCLHKALEKQDIHYACYVAPVGKNGALQIALDRYIEQAVGYLAPNVVTALTNILAYHLSNFAPELGFQLLYDHISSVVASLTATASGNTVTAVMQLQQCINNVLNLQDLSGELPNECIGGFLLSYQQVMLVSVAQQAFGYLPPNLVLDLQRVNTPSDLKSHDAYKTALSQVFTASGAGPSFVDCFVALEGCLMNTYETRQVTTCTVTLQEACKGLVAASRRM